MYIISRGLFSRSFEGFSYVLCKHVGQVCTPPPFSFPHKIISRAKAVRPMNDVERKIGTSASHLLFGLWFSASSIEMYKCRPSHRRSHRMTHTSVPILKKTQTSDGADNGGVSNVSGPTTAVLEPSRRAFEPKISSFVLTSSGAPEL